MKLKEQFELWWARKTIKDGRDFEIQMDDIGMRITILKGKFAGVEYRYSPLKVIDDEGLVDFHTVVEYIPENVDVADPKFAKLTTNILRILLSEAIPETAAQAKQEQAQVIDENRKVDTDSVDEGREFYEESSALLEKRVSKRKPRKKAVPADTEPHSEIQQPAKPKRSKARTTGSKRPNRK
jgi:hypothetical protein